MPQRGKPALISEELSTEIKQILSNLRVAGCSISRKVVISVGNGVLASRCPEKMSRNGGKINLNVKWASGILKCTMNRTMNPALYDELAFTRKKKIAERFSNTKFTMTSYLILIKHLSDLLALQKPHSQRKAQKLFLLEI